nr:MAG TPA: hypothetical protein [Caudoviricetes sp.]
MTLRPLSIMNCVIRELANSLAQPNHASGP